MWYVLQTKTGREQETVETMERILAGGGYRSFFLLRRECVWRREGRYDLHTELLFPSYVFVDTDTPETLFFALKQVPRIARLLKADGVFQAIEPEEKELLCRLTGGEKSRIIRCCPVQVDEAGEITDAQGALNGLIGRIVKKRLRKRSVLIEIPFLGKTKRIQLSIRLKTDQMEEQEENEHDESPIFAAGHYGGREKRGNGGAAVRLDHNRAEDQGV